MWTKYRKRCSGGLWEADSGQSVLFFRGWLFLLYRKAIRGDAHAAMRYVTALRYCGGAQSVQASQDSGEGGAGLTYILYFARMSSEVLQ